MKILADLHIHSKYSRATSPRISVSTLEENARKKGLDLLGTGDFTHPKWISELKSELREEEGILKTKTGFSFVLQAEVSSIYSQDGKVRKIHNVLLAPGFEVAEQANEFLAKYGNLEADGRPIFGKMPCPELVEGLKSISEKIEVIPAHVWTPWFSLFGSMSGFDSLEECFQEQSKHIHALETGLSSDPAMNWRVSELDKYTLVSNSDAHSFWPWRIGREANVFDIELTYDNLIRAIRTREGLLETFEVDPNYGKYHFDGHRNCDVCMNPSESKKLQDTCPKCGRRLTIGVLHRVEELADRELGFEPKEAIPFKTLMPLSELISTATGVKQLYSKRISETYEKLVGEFGSEYSVLLDAPEGKLKELVKERLAKLIMRNREGKIKVQPGYDGVYGEAVLEEKPQKTIGDF